MTVSPRYTYGVEGSKYKSAAHVTGGKSKTKRAYTPKRYTTSRRKKRAVIDSFKYTNTSAREMLACTQIFKKSEMEILLFLTYSIYRSDKETAKRIPGLVSKKERASGE